MKKRVINIYDLYWSPTAEHIAVVRASTYRRAIRRTPKPYSKFKGEVYAEMRAFK